MEIVSSLNRPSNGRQIKPKYSQRRSELNLLPEISVEPVDGFPEDYGIDLCPSWHSHLKQNRTKVNLKEVLNQRIVTLREESANGVRLSNPATPQAACCNDTVETKTNNNNNNNKRDTVGVNTWNQRNPLGVWGPMLKAAFCTWEARENITAIDISCVCRCLINIGPNIFPMCFVFEMTSKRT